MAVGESHPAEANRIGYHWVVLSHINLSGNLSLPALSHCWKSSYRSRTDGFLPPQANFDFQAQASINLLYNSAKNASEMCANLSGVMRILSPTLKLTTDLLKIYLITVLSWKI